MTGHGAQSTFGEFVEESADPFDFEDYGPTMKRPLPAEIVGREPWKVRMRAAGFSPGCLAEWHSHGGLPDYHVDDRETKLDRLAAEQLEELAPDQDQSADDARSTTRAVATDGGQPVEPDGCAAMNYNFENLDEIPRGAVLSLDKNRGEYLVVDRKEVPQGTVQAIDVIDKQGNEYRLQHVAVGDGRYFDFTAGHETAVVKNVDDFDDVRDFEVLRRDQDWLEDYLAEKYPHFSK